MTVNSKEENFKNFVPITSEILASDSEITISINSRTKPCTIDISSAKKVSKNI
jgi:hypothetical protein